MGYLKGVKRDHVEGRPGEHGIGKSHRGSVMSKKGIA